MRSMYLSVKRVACRLQGSVRSLRQNMSDISISPPRFAGDQFADTLSRKNFVEFNRLIRIHLDYLLVEDSTRGYKFAMDWVAEQVFGAELLIGEGTLSNDRYQDWFNVYRAPFDESLAAFAQRARELTVQFNFELSRQWPIHVRYRTKLRRLQELKGLLNEVVENWNEWLLAGIRKRYYFFVPLEWPSIPIDNEDLVESVTDEWTSFRGLLKHHGYDLDATQYDWVFDWLESGFKEASQGFVTALDSGLWDEIVASE